MSPSIPLDHKSAANDRLASWGRSRYPAIAAYSRQHGIAAAAQHFNVSKGTVQNARKACGVTGRHDAKSTGGRIVPFTRFRQQPVVGARAPTRAPSMPGVDNAALAERRTIYPSSVLEVDELVLKSGANQPKIGDVIAKGRWKGFPVYTLTLEERATCPTSCRHWRSCYGNAMHFARRFRSGAALEEAIALEVRLLARKHRRGFAIRLHVLGDFYSVEYVQLWAWLIEQVPQLHVFGFTARWERSDPIARELVALASERWDRFAIRFSNAPVGVCSTVSIEHPLQAPPDAVICPQQLGKTRCCATCALCWQSEKRIAFLQH